MTTDKTIKVKINQWSPKSALQNYTDDIGKEFEVIQSPYHDNQYLVTNALPFYIFKEDCVEITKDNHLVNYPTIKCLIEEITNADLLVIGSNLLIMNNGQLFWTKDGKYWAKTKEEIDFIESFKEVYNIKYECGLRDPINEESKFSETALDGYNLYVLGLK